MPDYLTLLYQALASPLGIVIKCDKRKREQTRQCFYRARVNAQDLDLNCLQISYSNTAEDELLIIRHQQEEPPNAEG